MIFSPSCKVLIVTLDPSGIETLHLLKMSIDEIFLKLKNPYFSKLDLSFIIHLFLSINKTDPPDLKHIQSLKKSIFIFSSITFSTFSISFFSTEFMPIYLPTRFK